MTGEIVAYDEDAHFETVVRHWVEIGWSDGEAKERERLQRSLRIGSSLVGLVDGDAEALGHWVPGNVVHLDRDLSMCAITAITTGPMARRHRFASRITAQCLAEGAEAGLATACLGIFDQGFYDRLGFGTGSYDFIAAFDPAQLSVPVPARDYVRLSLDDYEEMYDALVRRHRDHGGMVLDSPEMVRAELALAEKPLGIGFRGDDGRLTHFMFMDLKEEYGPLKVNAFSYEDRSQFAELLGVLRTFADQTRSVHMVEPAGIQIQDFLDRPFRNVGRTKGNPHATGTRASAWWQIRMLDVAACVDGTPWSTDAARFNVELTDPAVAHHDGDWEGVAGSYVIEGDDVLSAEQGSDTDAPTVNCSVGAFTRWWMGTVSASGLALHDDFDAPADLLRVLDRGIQTPRAFRGWDF